MTKEDLAVALAGETGMGRAEAARTIETLMRIASKRFIDHENIYLRGFGTFKIEERKARQARDVTRNAFIPVPAHHVVKFVPCKELKGQVR